jgi:diacylglycerol kinase family enzyme
MSAPPSSHEAQAFAATGAAAGGPWLIVLNPGSGRGMGEDARALIENELKASGRSYRFVPVEGQGVLAANDHAAELAAREGGVLVVAGGDGTVNCAAQAALRHRCPLGVIPMGTFNLFAREHGLSLDLQEATRGLLQAGPRPVQVGLVNQRVFLVNAAVGLYPKLLEDREQAKQLLGRRRRWIAVVAGLKSLLQWRWPLLLDAELDGEVTRLRTPSLFVCNNRLQLQRLGAEEAVAEAVGRGVLAALVAPQVGTWGKFKLLGRALLGRLADGEVRTLALRSLILAQRSARRLKVQTDGEVVWMELPLHFSVSPQPLMLLLPPEQQTA